MADDRPDGMDEVTHDLYGLDPKDFVAARNELARRLRAEKKRPLATEVAKLRRPSPAAWAVNQLARDHRSGLEELVRLGEELRAAQDQALAGASVDLRAASRARRDALSRLAAQAEALLEDRGGGAAAHAGEVAATLEAASLDEDAAAQVLAGRLTDELRPPSGFGVFDAPDVERRPRLVPSPAPAAESPADAEPEPDGRAERARQEAEEAVADARRRWEAQSARARDAVEAVTRRRQVLERAEAEVARLEEQLAEARRRLRPAGRDAEAAEDAAATAEDAAARASARLREAEQRLAELAEG